MGLDKWPGLSNMQVCFEMLGTAESKRHGQGLLAGTQALWNSTQACGTARCSAAARRISSAGAACGCWGTWMWSCLSCTMLCFPEYAA